MFSFIVKVIYKLGNKQAGHNSEVVVKQILLNDSIIF